MLFPSRKADLYETESKTDTTRDSHRVDPAATQRRTANYHNLLYINSSKVENIEYILPFYLLYAEPTLGKPSEFA